MAQVKLNSNSVNQAVTTADELLSSMEYFANKLKTTHSAGDGFASGYGPVIAQMGEALNAVNAILKTYNASSIED